MNPLALFPRPKNARCLEKIYGANTEGLEGKTNVEIKAIFAKLDKEVQQQWLDAKKAEDAECKAIIAAWENEHPDAFKEYAAKKAARPRGPRSAKTAKGGKPSSAELAEMAACQAREREAAEYKTRLAESIAFLTEHMKKREQEQEELSAIHALLRVPAKTVKTAKRPISVASSSDDDDEDDDESESEEESEEEPLPPPKKAKKNTHKNESGTA